VTVPYSHRLSVSICLLHIGPNLIPRMLSSTVQHHVDSWLEGLSKTYRSLSIEEAVEHYFCTTLLVAVSAISKLKMKDKQTGGRRAFRDSKEYPPLMMVVNESYCIAMKTAPVEHSKESK
jgi:hypothetical protein